MTRWHKDMITWWYDDKISRSHVYGLICLKLETQTRKVTRWQVDKMKGDNMARWEDDKMTGWQDDIMTRWQDDKMTQRHKDMMTWWYDDMMTRFQDHMFMGSYASKSKLNFYILNLF